MIDTSKTRNSLPVFDAKMATNHFQARSTASPCPSIDRDSPIPLYYQLYALLVTKIASGDLKPDTLFPSEKELSEQYDLSRTTVRQALQQMVSDEYLYRRQGLGTFVAKPKLRHGPQRDLGITGYLRAHGLKPSWRLVEMKPVIPPRHPALALGVTDTEQVLEITRLRLAADEVIGLHTLYVPFPLAESIQEGHMVAGESSLFYLQNILQLSLIESHRVIQAIPASQIEAELLGVEIDSPLLLIQRTTIAADGHPVEYMRAVYRGDRFEYYVYLEHEETKPLRFTTVRLDPCS